MSYDHCWFGDTMNAPCLQHLFSVLPVGILYHFSANYITKLLLIVDPMPSI